MAKVRSKSETKGQLILDAATILFTEQGYAATSMDQIAKKSGVSKQTVYSHFGSKDAMFSSAITAKCESHQFHEMSQVSLSDPHAALYQLGMSFYDMVASKEAMAVHKICCFESNSYPQLSELFFEAGPARVFAEFTALMEELNKLEEYDVRHTKYAATQFISMIKGESFLRLELNLAKQSSREEIESYIQYCTETFLKGYRAE